MKTEIIIQDNVTGSVWEISDLVSSISWDTEIENQPGKLTFDYINDNSFILSPGSAISFKVNGQGVFFGYVFKYTKTKEEKISSLAYDQMRYLKNKDTYVFSDMTASEVFAKLCSDFKLKYKIVSASSHKIASRVHDNKTLFEIIQYGLGQALISEGQWYIVRDNFGILEFVSVNSLKTNIYLGKESLLRDYSLETSIDKDTYNQVKLVKDNTQTQKRDVYVVKDSNTIKTWGTLQYFEAMDENANEAQIKEKAEKMLKLKNRETKTLKLNCLGDLNIRAGSGILLNLNDVQENSDSKLQYFMVTSCSHRFEKDLHTMQLEVQVSI